MENNVKFEEQKIVQITRAECDRDHYYMMIQKDALFSAMPELEFFELKVYIFLGSQRPDSALTLNPQNICKMVGGSTDEIEEGIRGLIEKGYLIQNPVYEGIYTFVQKVDNIIN